jgi:hypothetical protein
MHGRRAITALAALSGASVVGSLAGCSVAPSMSAHALAEAQAAVGASHSTHAPTPHPVIFDTDTPTPNPSATSTPSPSESTASKTTPKSTPTPHSSGKPKSTPSPTPTPTPTYQYTDGTYSSRGSYSSPGGHETLRVTLTVAHDVIQSLEVNSVHVDSTAQQYEAMFESGIDAVTVGRNLADLNVGAVGGSSLTCIGFNAAIANIQRFASQS